MIIGRLGEARRLPVLIHAIVAEGEGVLGGQLCGADVAGEVAAIRTVEEEPGALLRQAVVDARNAR